MMVGIILERQILIVIIVGLFRIDRRKTYGRIGKSLQ